MTLMCMAQAHDVFKVGVAGAPVTSWDGYDTGYTERYMGTPASNPNGAYPFGRHGWICYSFCSQMSARACNDADPRVLSSRQRGVPSRLLAMALMIKSSRIISFRRICLGLCDEPRPQDRRQADACARPRRRERARAAHLQAHQHAHRQEHHVRFPGVPEREVSCCWYAHVVFSRCCCVAKELASDAPVPDLTELAFSPACLHAGTCPAVLPTRRTWKQGSRTTSSGISWASEESVHGDGTCKQRASRHITCFTAAIAAAVLTCAASIRPVNARSTRPFCLLQLQLRAGMPRTTHNVSKLH